VQTDASAAHTTISSLSTEKEQTNLGQEGSAPVYGSRSSVRQSLALRLCRPGRVVNFHVSASAALAGTPLAAAAGECRADVRVLRQRMRRAEQERAAVFGQQQRQAC
jgi:hypothetical protein